MFNLPRREFKLSIDTSFDVLKKALGRPNGQTDTYEWVFDTPEGVATVYKTEKGNWVIGAFNDSAANHLKTHIEEATKE